MNIKVIAAVSGALVLAGSVPFALWQEQRWVDEFRRNEHENDCCTPQQRVSSRCVEPLLHLRLAAAGIGDPAYVARSILLECDPPPEVLRERESREKAVQEAQRLAQARLAEQAAKEQQARDQEGERARLAKARLVVPTLASGCPLLPPAAGVVALPAMDLAHLARLPPAERNLRLREAVCQRTAATSDALLALSGEAKVEVLCALPWRAAVENLQEVTCSTSGRLWCTILDEIDAGPDPGGDEGLEPCPLWRDLDAGFLAEAEARQRSLLEHREAALRSGPQGPEVREDRLLVSLRLGYARSLLGEITRVRNKQGPGTLLVAAQAQPGPAEHEAIRAAFGAEVAAAAAQALYFERAEVPGEGAVLLLAPCVEARFGGVVGAFWLSSKRALTLRPLGAIGPDLECVYPIDVADLDGDGVPEVLTQGAGEAQVWSVGAEGPRRRWSAPVRPASEAELGE